MLVQRVSLVLKIHAGTYWNLEGWRKQMKLGLSPVRHAPRRAGAAGRVTWRT